MRKMFGDIPLHPSVSSVEFNKDEKTVSREGKYLEIDDRNAESELLITGCF